jgi:predicted ATPase/transcriptional regulator with XRE-family HTH domain
MTEATSIEVWLKQARKAHDLTQKELAKRIGCSVRLIEKIERGERRLSRQMAELLAEAMEVPHEQRAMFMLFARAVGRGTAPAIAAPQYYAPWRAEPQNPGDIPTYSSELVGRDSQLQSLPDLIRSHTARLITVTGPPGIGKTRLAVEVARKVRSAFMDGTYFVPLGEVREPSELVPALATALRLRVSANDSLLNALRNFLAGKQLLLVLDTFEHLIPAADTLSTLLDTCSGLSVLVTSRERLQLSMEHELRLEPLSLPTLGEEDKPGLYGDEASDPDLLAQIAASEAVRLFVQRAEMVAPGFALTPENAGVVAEICRRLDGLPLAIELAASRVRALSPAAILEKLDQSLSLLTRGPRDLPLRLQTLRGAIDGSYTLLDAHEKALFRHLSIFRDGFTLDAVEAVYLARTEGSPQVQVLDLLEGLINKSLLQDGAVKGSAHRFSMLGALREYGLELLRECGEEEEARHRHACFYLELAEHAQDVLRSADESAWLTLLEREHENMRAALMWAWESARPDLGIRLVNALWPFWWRRGYWHEGQQQVERALQSATLTEPTVDRARVLLGFGFLGQVRGELSRAIDALYECIEISRKLNEIEILEVSLNLLGLVELGRGNKQVAGTHHEEALAISQAEDSLPGRASALCGQALQYFEDCDLVQARHKAEESVALSRSSGDQITIGHALYALMLVEQETGQYREAKMHAQEALEIFQSLRSARGTAHMLQGLGFAEAGEGNLHRAAELFRQSIAAFGEIGHPQFIPLALAGLARVELAQDEPVRAARLFGAALGMLEGLGNPAVPTDRIRRDPTLSAIRAALGQERFDREYAHGSTMDLEALDTYVKTWDLVNTDLIQSGTLR